MTMNAKSYFILIAMSMFLTNFYGQVGIGTVNPSPASMLEVSSTSDGGLTYKGLMPPRVPNVSARNAINPSVTDMGLLVFVESTKCLQIWSGTEWLDVKCFTDVVIPPTPVLLGKQDFEVTPSSPVLPLFSETGGTYTTGNGGKPNTPLYVSSVRGYGVNATTGIVTLGPIDASPYSGATFKLRLGGFSKSLSNGLENTDYVTISVSIDGVTGTFNNQLRIYGGPQYSDPRNNTWGFDATGTASVAYDSNGMIRTFYSGSGNIDGISYLEITGLPNSANLAFKILSSNNQNSELWVIDDAEVYSVP